MKHLLAKTTSHILGSACESHCRIYNMALESMMFLVINNPTLLQDLAAGKGTVLGVMGINNILQPGVMGHT